MCIHIRSMRLLSRVACASLLLAGSTGTLAAQTRTEQPAAQDPRPQLSRVPLTAGRSTVLGTDFDVTRIAITNPAIADAVVVAPREILIDGKAPGTVSLIVWGSGSRTQYDVVVEQGVTTLEQHLRTLFPGEDIAVSTNEGATILAGRVSTTKVMLRAAEIAAASMPKMQVVNLLQVPGGSDSQQVMLQVRFAEVNRKKVTEAGLALFVQRSNFAGRSTTQQFAAPAFDDDKPGGLVFSDFLNLFFFDRTHGIGGVLKALQSTGGFQSLAEPNLIAYNGQEASFLAGGEFPIPVVQGLSNAVTVVFKEFGIRLTFKPTIAGDVIRLKVRPEVSSLDFNNGLTLSGFRIPSLITRRAETDVELRDGQTFAIAGLMNNIAQNDAAAIPLLSKLPIIGPLFKSTSNRAEQTELMVLITPRLVRPLEPDEVPPLPTDSKRFIEKGGDAAAAAGVSEKLEGGAGLVDAPQSGNSGKVKR
jgi:pilus assembly protein CpaC